MCRVQGVGCRVGGGRNDRCLRSASGTLDEEGNSDFWKRDRPSGVARDWEIQEPKHAARMLQACGLGSSQGGVPIDASDLRVGHSHLRVPAPPPQRERFHLETLVIYKLSSRKFTTHNDLY